MSSRTLRLKRPKRQILNAHFRHSTRDICDRSAGFIESQTSVFLATASADGQPYIQHRGGPAGFLHVLDEQTIGFIDFTGNRQFISTGNLSENSKAQLFLIDYAQRRRIKIWGEASIVEASTERLAKMMPAAYKAQQEQCC